MTSRDRAIKRADFSLPKEISNMVPFIKRFALAFVASLCVCAALPPIAGASAAPQPWWQVLTGSRPTNLWEPTDNVQEIQTGTVEIFGNPTAAIEVNVEGKLIGCLGTTNFFGTVFCENNPAGGFAPTETAAELEALLESTFGTAAVEVTGGPVGGAPFVVTVPKRAEPGINVSPIDNEFFGPLGNAKGKVLESGGSGRLIITATNLGDAAVDATSTPVTLLDKLPQGVEATGVEAFAGAQNSSGPVECSINSPDEVSCAFGGTLPSFEAIEVEVLASLSGEPPTAGQPGTVTVSGGNAPQVAVPQVVKVSPEPTPFGIEDFSVESEEEGGSPATRAGGHPFQLTTTIQLNAGAVNGGNRRDARIEQPALPRSLRFALPAGLVGNASAMQQCPMSKFLATAKNDVVNECPDASAVGVTSITIVESQLFGLIRLAVPAFNLSPAQGEPARFGFMAVGTPVVIDTSVDPDNGYRIVASVRNASQAVDFLSSTVTLWGSPSDPRHDSARGWNCVYFLPKAPCQRPGDLREAAFLRQPVSCKAPPDFHVDLEPWNVPTGSMVESAQSTQPSMVACNQVPFDPGIAVSPTNPGVETASGLDFRVNMPNSGLLDPNAKAAEGQAKKVEVALPEGVTVNPSQANGLGACTPEDYARERFDSAPGEGCPESSRIGTVDISTPLLDEAAHGSVYVATPFDNPFDSLLGLYVVAKIPDRGILVKQAGKVELSPEAGQLVSTFDDLPQIPFDAFNLHLNEGGRAPLVMPSACGSYDITAKFTPWNAADPNNPQPNEIVTRTSSFNVDQGPNGGACPSGTPPFKPGFTAGTVNNAAGKYSPLKARLTREDGEQEFKSFSLKLPKGVIGKLAGIPFCPEADIAAARGRTGPNGGQEELDHPSCPAASQLGTTLVGAGVGRTLTYAPGKLYLAGPYKGAKLSVVAITTAKVGPFDLGNVVIRQGLKVNPDTAEVSTDGSSSDPIPHILQGIVVHARDIRIDVDRKDFILNPTSCERMQAAASVLGSAGAAADVSVPFQAADCANLGFKPKLALSLRGGTKRGSHPRLKAVLKARKGDANIGAAVVKLPHSEFLDQAHIRTICTRVQFAAGDGNGRQCPKGSIYGRVRAISPLLDEPLVGLVYLRSSDHPLPDLVAALHSKKVDINLDGRIDSVRGRIRNTFEAVPDAPVTKFVLEMQGGRKGLLVNSTDICQGKHRAKIGFTGQNGKRRALHPLLKARCGGKHKRRSKH